MAPVTGLSRRAPPKKVAVFGCNGHGREVLPLVRRQLTADTDVKFADDDVSMHGAMVNGALVIPFSQVVSERRAVTIAIGAPHIRKIIAQRVIAAGLPFFDVVASDVVMYDDVEIGDGVQLCARVTITSNVRIGAHFHANIHSSIAHDCVIGDYVTFGPHVNCNGRVVIGDGAYIGAGAVLKQGSHKRPLTIGAGAVVGMGAVVTKDVAPGATVVGNPAKPLDK